MAGLFGAGLAHAELDPLDQEKVERRLQFNEYYEKALREPRQVSPEEVAGKPWQLTLSSSAGYDTNPLLDIPAEGDNFLQEAVDFSWSKPHSGYGWVRPGDYGFELGVDWLTYEDETEADFLSPKAEIFATFDLSESLTLRESYRFAYFHYPIDEDLRYRSQTISSELKHRVSKNFEHEVYGDLELKSYADRNALDPENLQYKEKNREDFYWEAGYRMRLEAGPNVELGAAGGVKKNMSNDVFEDFSDYRGAQASGYAYWQISKPLALMFLGGYDYKQFEERHFPGSPRKAERDNFFYFGPSLYWGFAKNHQLILSYLFSENYSNDPQQEYFDQIMTATLLVSF